MSAQNSLLPEFVHRMEKIPAPYQGNQIGYTKDGLSRAMIAWMLDLDVRAAMKKRELLRTYKRICLYIGHMERLMDQNNIPYERYTGERDGREINTARQLIMPHIQAKLMANAPYPMTASINTDEELCGTVTDAQTFEHRLHQLEVMRYLEELDPAALTELDK
ncbi:hypothetical protein N7535_008974 [Penicillium sp. DV-2018c]|nr:hypothetical protein N7461_003134 [Penicillium sp. DV-2018c]KAJ5560777.1 hypothetical protein N7535_008974 [Penicillium sp. DV-2018c]